MKSSEKQGVSTVVEHELALKVYLDALLDEPRVETRPEVQTQVKSPVVEVAPIRPEVVVPAAESVTQEVTRQVAQQVAQTEAEAQRSDYPAWAQAEFDVLMFKVGGFLSLATPLVELNTILNWHEHAVTPMPGHAEWFLGLLPVRERQVKVIDIAKFVIPKNHKARAALDGERDFKHIIIVGGGEYGLACDDLGEVFKVDRDKVRWRSDRTQRPWLAGTVVEQMCALIDVDIFSEMLKKGGLADEIGQ